MTLIKEISRRHGIKGFDSELDDTQIQVFIGKVARLARDQNLTLERIKVCDFCLLPKQHN